MAKSKKSFMETAETGMNTGLRTLIPSRTPDMSEEELQKMSKEDIRKLAQQWKAKGGAGKVGRPRRADKDNRQASAAERGTKPGEARKTYLVNIEQAAALEKIAYWQRKKVKECLAEALQAYIDKNPINKAK